MIRVVDLFCGCGGLSLGFKMAGYSIEAAFDNWQPAIDIYKENFNHPVIKQDLNDIDVTELIIKYKPELIIGGPPCQDFSSAGKRNENLGRADLTISFANIISIIKPKYFVMENVDRIVKSSKLLKLMGIFKNAKYSMYSEVLDASYFQVPQKRKRYFLFGALEGYCNLKSYLDKYRSAKTMSIRDYFKDDIDFEYYYRHPRNYNRRAVFSIDEPSPTIRGVNRPVPNGYEGHKNDSISHKTIRPLTTFERSLIQTFPKDFKWIGTKTNIEQIIGNAVPVNLAYNVARAFMDYIASVEQPNCCKDTLF